MQQRLVAPGGLEATFAHNLPWHPWSQGACIDGLPDVTASVELYLDGGLFCVRKLVIRTPDRLLLFAQDGDLSVSPDIPVEVQLADIGCPVGPEGPCGSPQVFALEARLGLLEPIVVEQGRSKNLSWDGELYGIHNLRSFESGLCNDHWNYGFLVAVVCYDGTGIW